MPNGDTDEVGLPLEPWKLSSLALWCFIASPDSLQLRCLLFK